MGKLLLIPLLVGLFAFAFRMYEDLDMGRTIYNHRPGVCRQVHGPVSGSEDIELIRSEGIAFVSSGVLYLQPQRAHIEGKMFMYDFNQKIGKGNLTAKELPIKGESFDQNNFHPHGITHWVIDGVIRLYVINHDDVFKHSVEVFDFDPTGPALIHKKTFKHRTFRRPNNIAAVGPDQFLFTNDGVAQSEIGNAFEILIGYKGGSVFFWDGNAPHKQAAHKVLSGLGGPNGIAIDHKNNKMFIAEANFRKLHAYDLAKDKKSATPLSVVDLYSACDNLFVDNDGSVYGGCHPVIIEAAKSLADCEADTTSASQVLRIKFDKEYKTAAVSEPYANDGSEVSGSTIGVLFKNQMLIGTVCKGMLHCEVPHPAVL